eukprot:TRINITY_DN4380_c0_g1_i3.p1 TRINITY_DN4380_c0_g1~~TRINITY_DN4380_c0_g1_i3.p1  ORF type:complete len:120 (-),score=11.59 TRINITY_DN4380_c0_g1_i3:106-465(-)
MSENPLFCKDCINVVGEDRDQLLSFVQCRWTDICDMKSVVGLISCHDYKNAYWKWCKLDTIVRDSISSFLLVYLFAANGMGLRGEELNPELSLLAKQNPLDCVHKYIRDLRNKINNNNS